MQLSEEQYEHFERNGFVVIEEVLSEEEIEFSRTCLHDSIFAQTGIRHQGENWSAGIGARLKGPGMNMYYSRWKLNIQMHPNAVNVYKQLLKRTWGPGNIKGFEHPFGESNEDDVKCMTDRVCYRLPDCINTEGGLALHLDRNPLDPYLSTSGGLEKWRPIQGFICLTDHYDSGQGGLKVVAGFHHLIENYFSPDQVSPEVREACMGHRGEFFRMGGKSYVKLQKQLEVIFQMATTTTDCLIFVIYSVPLFVVLCQRFTLIACAAYSLHGIVLYCLLNIFYHNRPCMRPEDHWCFGTTDCHTVPVTAWMELTRERWCTWASFLAYPSMR